jgi:hypothetical protein
MDATSRCFAAGDSRLYTALRDQKFEISLSLSTS